jgi:ATP-dependent Lon protease|tara:strand:- start:1426 stop:1689 length:264 start_codon:yes stop_codon:yes gene_type:complete
MNKDKFIEEIFEIAFGETKLKDELLEEKDYQTVIAKIMEFSDNALKWEEAYPTLFQQFQKSLDLKTEEDYLLDERLDQFKKEISDDS